MGIRPSSRHRHPERETRTVQAVRGEVWHHRSAGSTNGAHRQRVGFDCAVCNQPWHSPMVAGSRSPPLWLGGQLFAQQIAFKRPNLVSGIVAGNLATNRLVKVFRRCSGTFAGHDITVTQ